MFLTKRISLFHVGLHKIKVYPKRSYSMMNHISKEKINWRKVSFGVVGMALLYYIYPKSPYPPTVNKPLRSGLYREMKYHDYETSLRFYIDARDECDRLNMNKTQNDYTGIEIKIAEMYEQLDLYKEAELIYLNILKRLANELSNNNMLNSLSKGILIKRDLSILSKMLENRTKFEQEIIEQQEELKLIETHLKLTTDEIFRRDASLLKLIMENSSDKTMVEYNLVNRDHLVSKYSNCFEPFQEEFITVRDQYTKRCLEHNDIKEALNSNMITVGWMILMNRPQGQILLSQANTASLLYLKVEQLDLQLDKLMKKQQFAEQDILFSPELNLLIHARDYLLDMSTKYFENVIANSGKTHRKNYYDDPMDRNTIQAISLSLYGLGVIDMHNGKYGKAQLFLKDSFSLAKDNGFAEIQEESRREIEKCKNFFKTN